jgi:hypothetical protein
MGRFTDNFSAVDADDLLRPVRNPYELILRCDDGEEIPYHIALAFTQTAFTGWRVWFLCPHCEERCRILYADGFNRVLWCRQCLGLRYRSQQRQTPLPPDIQFLRDAMKDRPSLG